MLVATVRALKTHGMPTTPVPCIFDSGLCSHLTIVFVVSPGGGPKIVPGQPLAEEYTTENLELLEAGLSNLDAQIAVCRQFGIPVVVSVSSGFDDSEKELEMVVVSH